MTRSDRVRLFLLMAVTVLPACADHYTKLKLDVTFDERCVGCDRAACGEPLEVDYLGSGGFRLRRGDVAIATAPFFSNPGFLATGLLPIGSDYAAVKAHMPVDVPLDAILVGHGHYDHLMDVPNVVRVLEAVHGAASNPVIYASTSALHSIAPLRDGLALRDLASPSPDPVGEGLPWISLADGAVRVLPIESKHAPHLGSITLFEGAYTEDLKRLPRTVFGWKEGQTYAFLIEFGPEGAPDFRIYAQDTASDWNLGQPPPAALDPRAGDPFTIVLPTVASWENVEGYPDVLFWRLAPDFAVLGHWEDFFMDYADEPADLHAVRATDTKAFVRRAERLLGAARVALPAPGARFTFADVCERASPD